MTTNKDLVSRDVFDEVKSYQDEGILNAAEVSNELDIPLAQTNAIWKAFDWFDYSGDIDDKSVELFAPNTVGTKGYLRSKMKSQEVVDIDKIKELTKESLEQYKILKQQIEGSWAMIQLLESRKTSLNAEIRSMEQYVQATIRVSEKHFEKDE